MKKRIFSFMMLTAFSVVCATSFTACGGDDDDVIGGEINNLTVGTHRIDVSFEGKTDGWKASITFTGTSYPITTEGSSLYENGEKLNAVGGTWTENNFRSYSISTDSKSQNLLVMVVIRKNMHATVQPVTVNLRSYVNGKQKKMKSIIVDGNHGAKTITFYSEIMDGDQDIDTDY